MSEHVAARHSAEDVNWWKTNQGIAVVLLAIFSALMGYLVFLTDSFTPLRDGFLLGFFPMASVGLCMAFSGIMLIDHLRTEEMPDYAILDWKFLGFVLLAIAWSGVFFWLLVKIGYVVTTPFYLFGLIYVLGLRPATSAFLAGVVIAGIILAIFWTIGAPMPLGPEWLMEKWGLPVL